MAHSTYHHPSSSRTIAQQDYLTLLTTLIKSCTAHYETHLLFNPLSSLYPDPLTVLHDDADTNYSENYSFLTDPANSHYYTNGFTDILYNFAQSPKNTPPCSVEMVEEVLPTTGAKVVRWRMNKTAQKVYIYNVARWLDLLKCVLVLCAGSWPDGSDLGRVVIDNEDGCRNLVIMDVNRLVRGVERGRSRWRTGEGAGIWGGSRGSLMGNVWDGVDIDVVDEEVGKDVFEKKRVVVLTAQRPVDPVDGKALRYVEIKRRILPKSVSRAVVSYLVDVVPFVSSLEQSKRYERWKRAVEGYVPDWNNLWTAGEAYCEVADWETVLLGEVRVGLGIQMTIGEVRDMWRCFYEAERREMGFE